ncbi:MAG: YafY family transcriptional regulator [Treponema sp.]|nr:YafY family transcriptional regulator [Treponema sp.]
MQIDQLFELLYILIDKKQVTASDMAKRFGVSTRTIYRWLDALSLSGIPVYALKGRGGGIAISEKFTMDNTILSEDERLAIVSSVRALENLSGKGGLVNTPERKAADKLSRLVTSDTDWLEVDFAPWSPEGSEVRNLFGLLRDSILKKRQITFDYFTGDGRSEKRLVHPWKLVFRGQSWYLLGWCTKRKAERFFKLTRMRNLVLTSKSANITRSVAVAEPAQLPEYSAPLIQIKAKITEEKLSYLMDSFICSEIKVLKNGWVNVTFTAPDTPWLCEILLSFGPQLKITSPSRLKNKIAEMAAKISELYK